MNRTRWTALGFALSVSLAIACSSPASADQNAAIDNERIAAARPNRDVAKVANTEDAYTKEDVDKARLLVMRADFEEAKNLSAAVKERNAQILTTLKQRRLEAITKGLSTWTKQQVVELESNHDYGYAFATEVAWGTGRYNGRPLEWIAYTNSDGWLQMNLSVALSEPDVNKLNGIEPSDREGAQTKNTGLTVRQLDQMTHIGTGGTTVDWIDEFCTQPNKSVCDVAGAFEKELLPIANKALSGLTFEIAGRFPR